MAFTVRKPGTNCNICRHEIEVGDQAQDDPKRPTWVDRTGKERKNYAHVSCVQAGRDNITHAPVAASEPVSTPHKASRADVLAALESVQEGFNLVQEGLDKLIEIVRAG